MSDEHKLLRDADLAAKAQSLLDNDMLKDALDGLEQTYSAALFETHVDAAQARERLFLAVNVVRKVRQHLAIIVNNGKLAQHELRGLVEAAERQKQWAEVRH